MSSAHATVTGIAPEAVVTGDTYGIELVAYNTTAPNGDFYAIQDNLMPTFGTTQTYASDALGGQTLTVTSSESTSGGITTDTISISVPTNFIPAGTLDKNGNVINALEFSIGNYNVPLGLTPNTLDFSTPVIGSVTTGSVVFSGGTSSIGLTQNPMFANGNESYSDEEAVQSASPSTPISGNDVTAFSVTLTYAAVPEPSTWAAMGLGTIGLLWVLKRRQGVVRA